MPNVNDSQLTQPAAQNVSCEKILKTNLIPYIIPSTIHEEVHNENLKNDHNKFYFRKELIKFNKK